MKPLTRFERRDLDFIRKDMNEALEAVAKKYGIKLRAGTISYSASLINVKVEGNILNAEGVAEETLMWASRYGLDATKTGPQGEKLIGFRPKAHKNPWRFSRFGKEFVCGTSYAMPMFKADAASPKSDIPTPTEADDLIRPSSNPDDMGFEEAPS